MLQCLPFSFFLRLAFRQSRFTVLYALLALLLLLFTANPLYAKEPPSTPLLRIEPELHTAAIARMAVDQAERYVVTASDDKTARVWDAKTGKLLQILRPPIADGDEGKLYAVAISPNGEQIAVAGWTGYKWDGKHSIYIFKRSTAEIIQRIQGLPNVINHLAYSPDGKVLAASLGAGSIRFYQQAKQSKQGKYQQVAEDTDYAGRSMSIDFDKDGNSVSTSYDGYIRLYNAHFKKIQQKKAPGGKDPFFARFSPNGKRIAVGFYDNTAIDILSADDLSKLDSPNTTDFDNGSLSHVAWSYDGTILYAGGRYAVGDDKGEGRPIVVWNSKDFASAQFYHTAQNTVMDIYPLRNGDVLFASFDPAVGRLDSHGKMLWKQGAGMLEYSGYTALRDFRLDSTGQVVGFHYQYENQQGEVIKKIAQWNSKTLALNHPDSLDNSLDQLSPPLLSSKSLDIQDWEDEYHPRLNGKPLNLKKYERSRSLAISSSSSNKEKPVFALGTEWYVRLYNAQGELQ